MGEIPPNIEFDIAYLIKMLDQEWYPPDEVVNYDM